MTTTTYLTTAELLVSEHRVRVGNEWAMVMDGPRSSEGWKGAREGDLLIRLEGEPEHRAVAADNVWKVWPV